jgi:hypothetical protein
MASKPYHYNMDAQPQQNEVFSEPHNWQNTAIACVI